MMQRLRLLVLGIVGFLSVFFAHGSWLNRLLAFTLCGILSTGSGLCLANVAHFSGQANATTPELVAQGRESELTGDVWDGFDNNLNNPPANPSAPPFPQDAGPDTIRDDFRGDPEPNQPSQDNNPDRSNLNRAVDSAIETPPPIDTVQRIRDEFKSPIYTYYINGINTNMSGYAGDVEIISNNLLTGIVDPPRIATSTHNPTGFVINNVRPGDFWESLGQTQDWGRSPSGREVINSVIEDIKQRDKQESEKAKTTCEDSPRAKFLIIGHSQGTLFIQDVAQNLPEEYSDRTVLFAMAPFTNFGRVIGKFRGFNYLLREDDYPAIHRNAPIISIPGVNLPRLPMLPEYQNDEFEGDPSLQIRKKQALDSHVLPNYLGSPTNPAYANDAQRSLSRARASVGALLNFDSGKYEKKEGCSQTASQPTPPPNASSGSPTVASGAPNICRVPEGFWRAHTARIATLNLFERTCIVGGPVMTRDGMADGNQSCGICDKNGNNTFGLPVRMGRCSPPEDTARTNPVSQCPSNWATGGEYIPTTEDVIRQVLPGVPTTPEELLQQVIPSIQIPGF